MQVIVQGRNVQVTDRLREYVEDKVNKLDRYLSTITEARMELATERTRSAEDRQVAQTAQQIYERLVSKNIDVLWDDRTERAGVKFKDADLIVGNLEGIITEKKWLGISAQKHDISILDQLTGLGHRPEKWLLCTSNNHSSDFGDSELSVSNQ